MQASAPVVPDFELLRQVGRGAYGDVWLARSVTGIHRAVKIVYRDRFEELRPFEREFAGIKRFEPISRSQGNLIDVLHVGRKDDLGFFYYVMELADPADGDVTPPTEAGRAAWVQQYRPRTLRDALASGKRLPIEECLPVAIGLARALQHLHGHGLIHRDIKPSNVIFVNGIPKLADIGLVSAVDGSHSFVGTEGFVPPEGPGTPAADLFSLGKVLYEMSTGRDRLEFPKLPEDLERIPKRESLLEFNEVVIKACHSQVKDRYTSAAELLDDLLLLQAGRSVKRLRLAERRLARLIPLGLTLAGLGLVLLVIQHLRARTAEELARVETRYRREAETQEFNTRQLLYAADMNLANEAFADGDLGRMKSLLMAHLPKPGEPDLRGFEWRYFEGLSRGDQVFTFPVQTFPVASLAVSPDGRAVASGGYDRRALLWDIANRQQSKAFTAAGIIEDVGFSPDGRLILISDNSPCVEAREIDSGRTTFQLKTRFAHMAVSPTAPLLALGGGGKQAIAEQGPACVWDYQANRQLYSLPEAGTYVAFSPDGRRLATGSANGKVKLWDVSDGHLMLSLAPVESNFGMSFSPDSRKLAIGDELGTLQVWDLETGRRLAGVQAHSGNIFKIAFSPDGKLIATVGDDQTARLWHSETLSNLCTLRGHASEVWSLAFTQDGRTLLTGGKDGSIRMWNVAPPPRRDLLSRDVTFWHWPVFSGDGQWLAAGEKKSGVTLWRVTDGAPAGSIADARRPLAFGTNGQTLLTLGPRDQLQCWSLPLTGGPPLRELPLKTAEIRAHAVLAERALLIAGDRDGLIHLWDVNSGAEQGTWKAHPGRINSLAVSPDHTRLATVSDTDDDARIWDLASHQLKASLRGQKMSLFSVAFSPDGRCVATASVDDTCWLWDAETGRRLAILGGHKGGSYSAAFSPDGKTLAVGGNQGQLKLWNIATRRDMMTLNAEPHVIFFAGFSPEGRTLATVSYNHHEDNCSLQLWRAPEATDVSP